MDKYLKTEQGVFELQRLPLRKNEQLRAWDAADEYLLEHLFENKLLSISAKVLIVNDRFGALSTVLSDFNPVAISDSYLSQQATKMNLVANNLAEEQVQLRGALDWPTDKFDLIIIKIPKTLALLEDQLIRLIPLLSAQSSVVAAGMVKAMPESVWKLMGKYIGETRPSLARKKARLIFTQLKDSLHQRTSPYPVYYQLENTKYWICNHANVFSRESLDIGTRFLLNNFPKAIDAQTIVDLGCGNGVVGLLLAEKHPSAELYFVDESYMAVASAKENFKAAFSDRKVHFCLGDGLTDFKADSMDLIVCNPPFHQQNTVGNQIALAMFNDAYRVLKKAGVLWVIGNRHLAYHVDLKKIFSCCNIVSSNKKFVIYSVKKS